MRSTSILGLVVVCRSLYFRMYRLEFKLRALAKGTLRSYNFKVIEWGVSTISVSSISFILTLTLIPTIVAKNDDNVSEVSFCSTDYVIWGPTAPHFFCRQVNLVRTGAVFLILSLCVMAMFIIRRHKKTDKLIHFKGNSFRFYVSSLKVLCFNYRHSYL